MTQKERRLFLIQSLLLEQQHDRDIEIPKEDEAQKNLLRSLFNIRMPNPVSKRIPGDTRCLFAGGNQTKGNHRIC